MNRAAEQHNKNADGLRGIAALIVAAGHFISAFKPSVLHYVYPDFFPENPAPGPVEKWLQFPAATLFYNGYFSVMIFFVLNDLRSELEFIEKIEPLD